MGIPRSLVFEDGAVKLDGCRAQRQYELAKRTNVGPPRDNK